VKKSLIQRTHAILSNERGDFSVKGLAITVGAIVVIGAVVTWLKSDGGMQPMIEQVWTSLGEWMKLTFELGW